MELELARNHVSSYDTVLDTTVLHEETMEMIVPDACPDILRIVDTAGTVCLKSKDAQEGRVELSGTVRCAVLYLPDGEDGMRRIEVNIPFFCTADNAAIHSGCSVVAVPRIQAAETRSLNPRKVLVRANLCISVRVFAPSDTGFCTGAECAPEAGVEQLCETHGAYMVASVEEKPFTFSDDVSIPGSRPEAEELLKSRVDLVCSESKIIGNKLIFKGTATLQILYRAGEGVLSDAQFELPFSQIMEVSDVEEDADCTMDVVLTDLSCAMEAGDGRTVSVAMGMVAQAVVRQERTVTLMTDIYGTASEIVPELETYTLCDIVERNTRRQTTREVLETGVLAKSVIDAYVNVGPMTQAREGGRLTLSAETLFTVIYLSEDNQICSASRSIPVPCQVDVPEGCTCTGKCRSGGEVFASPTSSGVEVRFDLEFEYLALSAKRVSGVSGVQVNEAAAKDAAGQPSIILRVVSGERLWDIAKAYRTTTGDIMQANELESEEGLSGRLLLIPKKR